MISAEQSTTRVGVLAALALACASCGTSVDEGTRLYVGVEHAFAGASPALHGDDEARLFTTDLGHEVTLEQGFVTVASVELFACEGHASFWHELRRGLTLVPEAHAHEVGGSDLELGVPVVDDLLRTDGESIIYGQMSPPAGEYCRVELTFDGADSDAEELPSSPDMVGVTLHLSGTVVTGGGEPQPFTYRDSGPRTLSLDLIDGSGASAPLALDSDHPEGDLVIRLVYDTWLDGVALDSAPATEIAAQALAQVEATCRHLGEHD